MTPEKMHQNIWRVRFMQFVGLIAICCGVGIVFIKDHWLLGGAFILFGALWEGAAEGTRRAYRKQEDEDSDPTETNKENKT